MKAAVFYATREGQAQRVAQRVAADLRSRGVTTDIIDVKDLPAPLDWRTWDAAFIVASVHAGHHEREMIDFVSRSKDQLTRLRASLLSLTLSQAGAEDATAPPARRAAAHADAMRMVAQFEADTGWTPARSLTVAGALKYSRYNFFIKLIMKRIARKAGFEGDTAHDYEFTNWPEVDRFVSGPPMG